MKRIIICTVLFFTVIICGCRQPDNAVRPTENVELRQKLMQAVVLRLRLRVEQELMDNRIVENEL